MSGIIREEYNPFAPQSLVDGKLTVAELLGQGMIDRHDG